MVERGGWKFEIEMRSESLPYSFASALHRPRLHHFDVHVTTVTVTIIIIISSTLFLTPYTLDSQSPINLLIPKLRIYPSYLRSSTADHLGTYCGQVLNATVASSSLPISNHAGYA